ncbi:hypothetical protein V2A60_002996 [Cordyceps javanica]|uniref:non-specific serine/threonine protein kinase n=1 Tax=Cordyceps javanica TaxID=43265 RepID=A0A545V4I2_9HYPO|nr:protein kinase [Cordyceps javanica]TQW07892.1 protein kinase [Cordyceps javanica]
MRDNNLIARLYAWPPQNSLASEAVRQSRFAVSPLQELTIAAPLGRSDGLPTPIDLASDIMLNQPPNPHIRISFDLIPKTAHGIVFGCDRESDVVLPDEGSISAHHFSIGFDAQRRLVVRDLNSTAGTEVWYSRKLSFLLVAEHQHMDQTEYNEYITRVDRFSRGCGASQALVEAINIRLQCQSQLMNEAMKLEGGPIYREEVVGQGAFGRFKYKWNVSTGEEMVLKEPISGNALSQSELRRWKEEAYTMQKLRHSNVVKLLWADFLPRPQPFIEYCVGGTLTNIAHELGAADILQVLQQSLSALQFAHKVGIAHRDLKLDNILIASRDPLRIKLADFGIAKLHGQLQSVCGTPPFMAPDIWAMRLPSKEKYYTKAVDIWALGVVIYRLLFELPAGFGPKLCLRIVHDLHMYLKTNRGTIAEFLANTTFEELLESLWGDGERSSRKRLADDTEITELESSKRRKQQQVNAADVAGSARKTRPSEEQHTVTTPDEDGTAR